MEGANKNSEGSVWCVILMWPQCDFGFHPRRVQKPVTQASSLSRPGGVLSSRIDTY